MQLTSGMVKTETLRSLIAGALVFWYTWMPWVVGNEGRQS